MNRTENIKGFTIIEVVLVLAIAGLIFLMVFIALPALQAGQRDTARKSDVSNVASAVSTYTGSNRGSFPAAGSTLDNSLGASGTGTAKKYSSLSNNITSVTVVTGVASGANVAVPVVDGGIKVVQGKTCGTTPGTSDNAYVSNGTARQYVVLTRLEGGSGTGYCLQS